MQKPAGQAGFRFFLLFFSIRSRACGVLLFIRSVGGLRSCVSRLLDRIKDLPRIRRASPCTSPHIRRRRHCRRHSYSRRKFFLPSGCGSCSEPQARPPTPGSPRPSDWPDCLRAMKALRFLLQQSKHMMIGLPSQHSFPSATCTEVPSMRFS